VRHILERAAEAHPGRRVRLSVKRTNVAARLLYERHGFVVDGQDPADASELRMSRPGLR
jgi:Acetyltransferases